MTVPTQAQLDRIRYRPHRTRLWLGIYQPTTIAVAKIGSGHSKADVELTVTWESGDYSLIREGMTAYIGTTSGGVDKGRIRVREAGATTIKVAENAITWQENQYLTVVEYFEPWSVFPRITLDSDNVPTFYKDYDIAYTNQNQIFDPVVCLGPHHAGFLETGTHSVWYTHSGTYDPTPDAPHITGSTFEWYFGDEGFVDPTGTTDQEPGWVHYHSGGHYTTRLTVTTAAGKSFTGYRHVQIYDRPGEGPNRPFTQFGIENLEGSRGDGGYEATFWVREEAGYSQIKDGALVVVFSDDWQGSDRGAIGGNAENRESILFVGYIDTNTITLDPITNRIEFNASSITRTMEELSNYSASVESKENAMTWYQVRKMTVDRAMVHLLRWHSTVLAVADFSPTDDDRQVQYADFDRGSLYETADSFLESTLGARMVADRQGKIWNEIDLNLVTTGSARSGYQTALDIERRDWRDSISINSYPHSRLAYVEMGGISYDGPETGTIGAYLTGAPGNAQLYRGSVERISGLVVLNQDSINTFAGHYLARENAEFPEVEVPLAGDYRFIDIAPQERVTLTLEEGDTYRGYVWDSKKFLPQSTSFEYEPETQSMFVDLSLYEETEGEEAGETIEIPEDPPYDTPDLPPWEWTLPPILPLPPVEPPVDQPPTTGRMVYAVYTNWITRCRDVWAATPQWESVNVPSDLSNVTSFIAFRLDPSDPLNTAYLVAFGSGGIPTVWKTQSLNATTPSWSKVVTESTMNLWLGTNARAMNIKITLNGSAIVIGASGQYGCDGIHSCPKIIRSLDAGGSWESFQVQPNRNDSICAPNITEYLTGIVYMGSRFQRWRSTTFGTAWTSQEAPSSNERPVYCCAILNASGASTMWLTDSGGDDATGISTDDGATMTRYLQLTGGGNYLAPLQSRTTFFFGAGGDNCYNVFKHPVSGTIFGLLTTSKFGVWTGAGWVVRFDFNDATSYGPYHCHYGSEDFHYVMGGNSASAPWLTASDDGGYTWYDIEGNFASAIDSLASMNTELCIEPVHNV